MAQTNLRVRNSKSFQSGSHVPSHPLPLPTVLPVISRDLSRGSRLGSSLNLGTWHPNLDVSESDKCQVVDNDTAMYSTLCLVHLQRTPSDLKRLSRSSGVTIKITSSIPPILIVIISAFLRNTQILTLLCASEQAATSIWLVLPQQSFRSCALPAFPTGVAQCNSLHHHVSVTDIRPSIEI
ncbi:uncharacterized protein FOMMEDRAFT_161574 [Fomitiporia mediterranea MF3/22]|uniref:uncharacterized protein n=1 Tax=Fomitiporia mediterranea (strain MF3/22) TaxID=694068 RepID=UPI0004408225|nr:uncharacterized protein FOMMEDRAFT_161574 [Fomitiporia mediterranea MF3/22]EJC98742.1 hypothetical protein FOMMEDRAFT_161574 [Fomitiporia mediterranea MF3/22]